MLRHLATGLLCLGALTLAAPALAVPGQVAHQGRLLDADDLPLEDEHTLLFRLYNEQEEGDLLWEESHDVAFSNGFYSLFLGEDEADNPIDDWFTGETALYLELSLDGGEPLVPRQLLTTVPYATTSTNVAGGSVDATEISVGGEVVVDSSGNWVGEPSSVSWEEILNIPVGFADEEDADTLVKLSCADGELAAWDAGLTEWVCAIDWDSNLTESEVESYVVNDALDLHGDTTIGGSAIATGAHTIDTDTDTHLSESEVEDYVTNDALDLDSGTTIGGSAIATGAHTTDTDTDTHLSESEVEDYVVNDALDLDSGTTIGGSAIATGAHTTDTDGADITPASVTIQGTSTSLQSGELDLGSSTDDSLTAAMVQTLTGGGDADSLHSHASASSSGSNRIVYLGITGTERAGDATQEVMDDDCASAFGDARMCRMSQVIESYPAPRPDSQAWILVDFQDNPFFTYSSASGHTAQFGHDFDGVNTRTEFETRYLTNCSSYVAEGLFVTTDVSTSSAASVSLPAVSILTSGQLTRVACDNSLVVACCGPE